MGGALVAAIARRTSASGCAQIGQAVTMEPSARGAEILPSSAHRRCWSEKPYIFDGGQAEAAACSTIAPQSRSCRRGRPETDGPVSRKGWGGSDHCCIVLPGGDRLCRRAGADIMVCRASCQTRVEMGSLGGFPPSHLAYSTSYLHCAGSWATCRFSISEHLAFTLAMHGTVGRCKPPASSLSIRRRNSSGNPSPSKYGGVSFGMSAVHRTRPGTRRRM